jgi:disulfide bond formation protein DsbB
MKNIGNAEFLRRRRFIVDVLIGVAILAVAVAALGATAAILYMLSILGALAGIGLMLEAKVMAQPPGDTGAESLRPLAEPKLTRPGPQVIRRIDTAIVDATSV